jgi:xylulokinase
MSRSPAVVAGLDLGTSAMKGVLVDGDGRVIARARAGYRTLRPAGGRAEQRPSDWIAALERVCATLGRTVAAGRWRAIGLSGMIPTLVLLDDHDEPAGRAITWEDTRAERQAEALRRRIGAGRWYRTTGQWVDGRYLAPMWRWIVEHDPARAERARRVVAAKDLLLRWLTGELATDPSTATGFGTFDLHTDSWDEGIGSAAGLDRRCLPTILGSTRALPLAREPARRLGLAPRLPVAVGAADSVLSIEALGGLGDGAIAYVSGTSTVIVSTHDRIDLDARHRYLVTPTARAGRWGLEMDLVSTGSAAAWLASASGLGSGSSVLSAAEASEDADEIVFLPYVGPGEQGALWDPSLRGTIAGLTVRDGPNDIARALVDGIVLESRRCVSILRARGAEPLIRTVGPFGRSRWFRRRLADATGCAVAYHADASAAVGAAALCDPSLFERLRSAAERTRVLEPDPSTSESWASRWERHERLRRGLTTPP